MDLGMGPGQVLVGVVNVVPKMADGGNRDLNLECCSCRAAAKPLPLVFALVQARKFYSLYCKRVPAQNLIGASEKAVSITVSINY